MNNKSERKNLLVVMADEHAGQVLGCEGHPIVKTPNIDQLAARGTRFTSAYTDSPICVPARAAFATGRPIHETGNWDNAFPYTGEPQSWGHALQKAGVRVESIGKLHYRNKDDDTGFDVQSLPMHVVDGVGDVLGAVRDPLVERNKCRDLSEKIGEGDTNYTDYDTRVVAETESWFKATRDSGEEGNWVLFVSLVCPHFPLIAPPKFYNMYRGVEIPQPVSAPPEDQEHPWIKAMRNCFTYDRYFTEESRREALAAYYGLCSFADDNLGKVLSGLQKYGFEESTQVIYLSDHGDNMGARGLWGKSTFYEESARIPIVMAGPDIPTGEICNTPVLMSDMYATILDANGIDTSASESTSLFQTMKNGEDTDRAIVSQYHAAGSPSGGYMLRQGNWKYCYYVGMPPQLFDLSQDPQELNDLASDPRHESVIDDLNHALRAQLDPEAVDALAKRDQNNLIERHGGRKAVLERGTFGPTPPPGVEVKFVSNQKPADAG